jgi:hypothetical protein
MATEEDTLNMKKKLGAQLKKIDYFTEYIKFIIIYYFGILFASLLAGVVITYLTKIQNLQIFLVISGITYLLLTVEFLTNSSNPKRMKKHILIYSIITLILLSLILIRILIF